MSSRKEAVILVVITFLLVILVHSSFSRSNMVFAYRCENYGDRTVKCCQTNPDGKTAWCTNCDKTNPPSNCSTRYLEGNPNTSTPPPPNKVLPVSPPTFSNVLPPPSTSSNPTSNNTSTQSALSITKEHNLASPKIYSPPSQQQQTTICPDGSTPDANDQCPPPSTTTGNQNPQSLTNTNNGGSNGNSNTNNNDNSVPSQQHTKGSNLLGHAGELTGKKKGRSPTPPPCPTDNSPIPPNCTLKPKF